MLKTITKLLGENKKRLYLPITLTVLDAFGAMAIYIILYKTIVDLLGHNLNKDKIIIYSMICFISIIYRILIYRKGYLLCFTRGFDLAKDVRIHLGEHICSLNLGYFNNNNKGYLLKTLTNDVASFEGIITHALPFCIKTFVVAMMIMISMLFMNLKLALTQITIIIISFPILHWSGNLLKKYSNKKRFLASKMISTVMEYVRGFKVFKSHNMTDSHFERLLYSMEDTRKLSIQAEQKMALPNSMYSIVVNFFTPLVLLVGSVLIHKNGLKQESFIAFMIMSLALSTLLVAFEHYYIMLQDLKLASKNLEKVMDIPPLPFKIDTFYPKSFDVEFKDVHFSYETGKEVLHDISFTAKYKSKTALIGPSGSGKTTIANLIARFWDCTKGKIRIGNTNIKEIKPDSLLNYISEVFQENTLLNDSIYNNIKVGNPNATKEDIIRASKLAYCHEFIMKQPNGYDTIISEGGSSLSGGERQRIAIARAILKNAPILLLDESTSSLDPDNEFKINQALDELMKDKTVFVIAHRLHTIKNADKIILLNQGKIEEMGTHENLMKQKRHYYHMVKEQEQAIEWTVKEY